MDIYIQNYFPSLDNYMQDKINRTSYPNRLDFIKTNLHLHIQDCKPSHGINVTISVNSKATKKKERKKKKPLNNNSSSAEKSVK
jgi:hypothetical protein